ncbi:MAG: MOSC domain-containing protein [Methylophagaceae bacterium]
MKLVSINISLAIDIEYNNKTISTGIFKKPVNSDVTISSTGLHGDQQVDLKNHGGEHKAVYGFSADHYDYWRKTLHNPELAFGQFGENLTITGLDEALLCIGDQLQIGSCILEITQPRVPCFKLGIALDLKEMPTLFVQHGTTGIYFRVLQAGAVSAGDSIQLIYQQPKQLTVQTLFKAYFDRGFIEPEHVLKLAAEIPELSTEWRTKVLSRLAKA